MALFDNIDPATSEHWLTVPGDWRRPAVPEQYPILWDAQRGYGQVWPRPDASEIAEFYRVPYYTHSAGSSAAGTEHSLPQRVLTKLSWLADRGVEADRAWWQQAMGPAPRRVLEIGCGSGWTLELLSSLGHRVTGVEPDPSAVQASRSRGLRVLPGTGEALPEELAGEQFDAVIFMHVLEHVVHPTQALRNALRLLAPGGILVCEVPNNDCLARERFGEFWFWLDAPRHLNFFTEKSLRTLFQSLELEVMSIDHHGYCRQFAPGWQSVQRRIARIFGRERDRRVAETAYWTFLFRTALAGRRWKYDSLRLVARPGNGGADRFP